MPTFSFSEERYNTYLEQWADYSSMEYHFLVPRKVTTTSGSQTILQLPSVSSRWYGLPAFQEAYGVYTWEQLQTFLREYFPVNSHFSSALTSHFDWEYEAGEKIMQETVTLKRGLNPSAPITIQVERSNEGSDSFVLLSPNREEQELGRKLWYDIYWHRSNDGDKCFCLSITRENVRRTGSGIPEIYRRILNYSYRPDFVFYRGKDTNSNLFFGVEVELSTELTPSEFYRILTEVEPKQEPFFYFKSDSSVGGSKRYQMELVTHPCHPAFLRRNFRVFFQKLEHLCKEKGVRLEDVFDIHPHDNNGIHVHVSADSFTSQTELNKFVSLWNMDDKESVEFLQQISKRNQRYDNNRFCRINSDLYQRKTIYRLRNNGSALGRDARYSACHYTGNTVEVRLFQSIFDLNHILNTISIVEAMHQFNSESSYSVLSRDLRSSFEQWVVNQGRFVRVKRILKGEK